MSFFAQSLKPHFKSAAKPAPIPDFFVGVLTDTKIRLLVSIVASYVHSQAYEPHSLSLRDGLVDVRAEEEVLAPCGLDNLIEARLVDGEVV